MTAALWLPLTEAPIEQLWLLDGDRATWETAAASSNRLASHVDVVARWADATLLTVLLARAIAENPVTLFDCYLSADAPTTSVELRAWRALLPYEPGYLDRVAVYRRTAPEPPHMRVSPRLWLILPWTAQVDPSQYMGIAEIIWEVELATGEMPPLGAWRAAGGAGVLVRGPVVDPEIAIHWAEAIDGQVWVG
jgi:hypothetical protein